MAEQKQLSEEDRYKYIGFESFGKKVKPFWRNDNERSAYMARVKEQLGSVFRNSVVYANPISIVDRVILSLASLVMIVAPFLVWIKANTIYGPVDFTGITGFLNLDGFWFYVELMGGSVIPLTVGDNPQPVKHLTLTRPVADLARDYQALFVIGPRPGIISLMVSGNPQLKQAFCFQIMLPSYTCQCQCLP